jgi:site-specific DNA-cytosine methylase
MSFPDSFKFVSTGEQSMTSVAKQIGNAVPPVMAEAVAKAVAGHLSAGCHPASSVAA